MLPADPLHLKLRREANAVSRLALPRFRSLSEIRHAHLFVAAVMASRSMTKCADTSAPLFEIQHGDAVVQIADDWSGHVLIEQIYDGLRQARRSRDEGRVPLVPPASGSEASNAIIEVAEACGFRPIEGAGAYRATAEQIVALVTMVRERSLEE